MFGSFFQKRDWKSLITVGKPFHLYSKQTSGNYGKNANQVFNPIIRVVGDTGQPHRELGFMFSFHQVMGRPQGLCSTVLPHLRKPVLNITRSLMFFLLLRLIEIQLIQTTDFSPFCLPCLLDGSFPSAEVEV